MQDLTGVGRRIMDRSRIRNGLCCGLLALLALATGGCATWRWPRIDPSGERIFLPPQPAPPKYKLVPGPVSHTNTTGVQLTPAKVIAPVGTEVVMTAAVCGHKGFLSEREPVQWSLAPGGVGEFIQVGDRQPLDYLFPRTSTQKVNTTYALNATSSKNLRITRGTPNCYDDVAVLKGQAWVTVMSPMEGTSYVTAFVPNTYAWDVRQRTAQIHWVDAQWAFPPPAVNSTGARHTFTTTVHRYTTREPVANWRVRYEIMPGGPPAGFAPDGSPVIEVATNALGQGNAEIFQKTPSGGTNTICVQLVRPAEVSRDGERLVVAASQTSMSWNAAAVSIDKSGPSQATIGSTVSYRIEVANRGSQTSRDVVVSEQLVDGLTVLSSTPPGAAVTGALEWRLGDLGPGQSRAIELSFRADRAGTLNNCATARTAEGLTAQDCVATTILAPTVEISLAGPDQALVGEQVTFTATITNRGGVPVTGLTVVDRFDPGLQHAVATGAIERNLDDLQPGQSRIITVDFRVATPGQLCNTLEVIDQSGIKTTAQKCLTALPGAGGVAPVPVPVPGSQPAAPAQSAQPQPQPTPDTPKPVLNVRKTGPAKRVVGDTALFDIEITNTGRVPANMLKVTDNYDAVLEPVEASDGNKFVGLDLEWLIDTLPVGKTIRLQVKCRCDAAAARACNRVIVTCQEGARGDAEACVEIQNAPPVKSQLTVTASDLGDPVSVNGQSGYVVRVTNAGTVAEKQVRASIAVPAEMSILSTGMTGPATFAIDGQTVRFDPVAELKPGETLTYRVPVRAARAGAARARVEVTSTATPQPVTAEETTTVLP